MSHTLKYPYTEEERVNFIVGYNHNQGLRIETFPNEVEVETSREDENGEIITETTVVDMPTYFALEPWELLQGDEVIDNAEAWEQEQVQKEKERIAKLYLTGADVERGIYQATGMDFDDVMAFIESQPSSTLDIKAIKIELKANNFYRGNPYVSAVGALLGFTEEQLDKFFETNDYTTLLPQSDKVSDIVTEQVEVE